MSKSDNGTIVILLWGVYIIMILAIISSILLNISQYNNSVIMHESNEKMEELIFIYKIKTDTHLQVIQSLEESLEQCN